MASAPALPTLRRLVCGGCGTAFDCALSGECWCAAEPYRLPMPEAETAADCLCSNCLREAAEAVEAGEAVDAAPHR